MIGVLRTMLIFSLFHQITRRHPIHISFHFNSVTTVKPDTLARSFRNRRRWNKKKKMSIDRD
jgi:hypothetical protein